MRFIIIAYGVLRKPATNYTRGQKKGWKSNQAGKLVLLWPEGLLNRKEETVNRKQGGIQLVSQGGSEICLAVRLL